MSFFHFLACFGRKIGKSAADFFAAAAGELFWDGWESPSIIPGKSRRRSALRRKDVIGGMGEDVADDFLLKKGWRIIEKNLVLPSCEFDLIAWDSGTLVFVEVKTRRKEDYAYPLIEVDVRRQRKMIHARREFFQWRGLDAETPFRFDVLVIITAKNGPPQFNHAKDAFRPRS